MAIGLLGRKVGMTQIFDEAASGSGDGDRGRSLPRAAVAYRRSATVTKRCRSAFSTSPAGWPVALSVVRLPSSTASGPKPAPRPASSRSPRPIASRSGSSANSAVRSKAITRRPEARRQPVRRRSSGRCHRHQQGPRHGRRHGAAQLQRPAGHARREESPSPSRLASA